ncbi:hypothetical protein JW964_00340 [candidate division KSB1 bacterium]|nr:hypothetical protein [candidate division KSB1 bacterium]
MRRIYDFSLRSDVPKNMRELTILPGEGRIEEFLIYIREKYTSFYAN